MEKSGTVWITTTAFFIALLIVAQLATAPLGQIFTGSAVNFVLIVAVMTCGYASGITVTIVSPIVAHVMGIGPFWPLIPFIIAGNFTLVTVWHFMSKLKLSNKTILRAATLSAAAVCKFIVLYIGIVTVAVPFLLNLSEQQSAMITVMFSAPQLVNALIGGTLAAVVLPAMERFIKF